MNLLVINHAVEQMNQLLPEVLKELKQLGFPGRTRLVYDLKPQLKHQVWALGQPTAVVSFRPIERFKPNWAYLYEQKWISKAEEYVHLESIGVPVPKWALVTENHMPDLSEFDELVVVKPAEGAFGALVKIWKKAHIKWRSFEIQKNGRISNSMIVQKFIYTGPWPVAYRVGTCFGEPYYAWRVKVNPSREPFNENIAGSDFFTGKTIVSTSKGCVKDSNVPEDVLALARKAHKAFPNIPLLGTDIIRDYKTGELYVLEVNASGGHFHLTTSSYVSAYQDFGFDLRKQFGGAKAVARGLYQRFCEAPQKQNSDFSTSQKLEAEAVLQ